MSNIIPPTIAAALRPDSNSRQLIPGTRGARPSRFLATRTLGASLVAIVAMVLCASRASGQVPDTLWARSLDNQTISVCQNPTAPASISGCFGAASQIPMPVSSTNAINPVTDGTNVYIGDYRCPVADYGQNCIKTQIGWAGFTPDSIAAANGYLWLASSDSMSIYRCPSNLPFTNATSMPTECELLATPNVSPNSSKSLAVYALAYANGKLYVGITSSNGSEPSYLFSCDPNQTQDCAQLDMLEYKIDKIDDEYCYGGITSIAVGSGYVWVGLVHACDQHENRLLRCDPVALNSCQTWDTAGLPIVDVAHDGQGTVWAAVNYDQNLLEPRNKDDVVWSCPTTSANSCTNAVTDVNAYFVTAGAGHGFSSADAGSSVPPIYYEGTQYPQSVAMIGPAVPEIVYVPAGGAVGLGGVKVSISPPAAKVARVCAWRGTLPATIHVKGPHRIHMTRRFNLCDGRSWVRKPTRHFDLLPPETYAVRVRSSEFSGTAEVEVTANRTARLAVKLRAPGS